MSLTSTINIRIDKNLKEKSGEILKKIGLDISSAVKMFLNQVVNTKSIPFEPKMHFVMTAKQSKWVKKQVMEAKRGKAYASAKELFDDILAN